MKDADKEIKKDSNQHDAESLKSIMNSLVTKIESAKDKRTFDKLISSVKNIISLAYENGIDLGDTISSVDDAMEKKKENSFGISIGYIREQQDIIAKEHERLNEKLSDIASAKENPYRTMPIADIRNEIKENIALEKESIKKFDIRMDSLMQQEEITKNDIDKESEHQEERSKRTNDASKRFEEIAKRIDKNNKQIAKCNEMSEGITDQTVLNGIAEKKNRAIKQLEENKQALGEAFEDVKQMHKNNEHITKRYEEMIGSGKLKTPEAKEAGEKLVENTKENNKKLEAVTQKYGYDIKEPSQEKTQKQSQDISPSRSESSNKSKPEKHSAHEHITSFASPKIVEMPEFEMHSNLTVAHNISAQDKLSDNDIQYLNDKLNTDNIKRDPEAHKNLDGKLEANRLSRDAVAKDIASLIKKVVNNLKKHANKDKKIEPLVQKAEEFQKTYTAGEKTLSTRMENLSFNTITNNLIAAMQKPEMKALEQRAKTPPTANKTATQNIGHLVSNMNNIKRPQSGFQR